jgi:hypothetical protein
MVYTHPDIPWRKEFDETIAGKRKIVTYGVAGIIGTTPYPGDAVEAAQGIMRDDADARASSQWVEVFRQTRGPNVRFRDFSELWAKSFVAPEGQAYVDSRVRS